MNAPEAEKGMSRQKLNFCVMKQNKDQIFENEFVKVENASQLKGGKDHILKFCHTVELKECVTMEGKYCGNNVVEVKGPTNPW
jgi:hypothetical protein